jgi:WD40 repeat protein
LFTSGLETKKSKITPSALGPIGKMPSIRSGAVGCGPGEIYVHAVADDQDVAELHGHSGRVLMIGFTADPDVLISAAADGTIRSWSRREQKQLAEVRADASLQAAALDAEGGIVLAASAGGTMAIRIPTARATE